MTAHERAVDSLRRMKRDDARSVLIRGDIVYIYMPCSFGCLPFLPKRLCKVMAMVGEHVAYMHTCTHVCQCDERDGARVPIGRLLCSQTLVPGIGKRKLPCPLGVWGK